MITIKVLDSSGDKVVSFERNTAAEAEARELFEKLAKEGRRVFPPEEGLAITDFDKLPEGENIAIPRLAGG